MRLIREQILLSKFLRKGFKKLNKTTERVQDEQLQAQVNNERVVKQLSTELESHHLILEETLKQNQAQMDEIW